MAVKLSSALAQLLGKMAGLAPGAAKGEKSHGLHKGDQKHPAKGDLLGEQGELLVGLGFNPEDRTHAAKNIKEQANVHEFVQARGETKSGQPDKTEKGSPSEEKKADEGRSKPGTGQEERALKDEARAKTSREERAEEARGREFQETAKEEPARREREVAKEPLIERVKDRDEDAHGHAWVREAVEEEEEERAGYRNQEVLSDQLRCHGTQDDGARCLRRSMDGQPFCRAHLGRGQHTP